MAKCWTSICFRWWFQNCKSRMTVKLTRCPSLKLPVSSLCTCSECRCKMIMCPSLCNYSPNISTRNLLWISHTLQRVSRKCSLENLSQIQTRWLSRRIVLIRRCRPICWKTYALCSQKVKIFTQSEPYWGSYSFSNRVLCPLLTLWGKFWPILFRMRLRMKLRVPTTRTFSSKLQLWR